MGYWIQRIFLVAISAALFIVPTSFASDSSADPDSLDNELFEVGVSAGMLNLQDFGSNSTLGLNLNFLATEKIFMQFNIIESDIGYSAYESNPFNTPYFTGNKRKFKHHDLLVGYDILQGEQFFSGNNARLSAMYLLFGVGDTQFGGEESFTYTWGLGYRVALSRRFNLRFDYKNYIYDSSLITDEYHTVSAENLSLGLTMTF